MKMNLELKNKMMLVRISTELEDYKPKKPSNKEILENILFEYKDFYTVRDVQELLGISAAKTSEILSFIDKTEIKIIFDGELWTSNLKYLIHVDDLIEFLAPRTVYIERIIETPDYFNEKEKESYEKEDLILTSIDHELFWRYPPRNLAKLEGRTVMGLSVLIFKEKKSYNHVAEYLRKLYEHKGKFFLTPTKHILNAGKNEVGDKGYSQTTVNRLSKVMFNIEIFLPTRSGKTSKRPLKFIIFKNILDGQAVYYDLKKAVHFVSTNRFVRSKDLTYG